MSQFIRANSKTILFIIFIILCLRYLNRHWLIKEQGDVQILFHRLHSLDSDERELETLLIGNKHLLEQGDQDEAKRQYDALHKPNKKRIKIEKILRLRKMRKGKVNSSAIENSHEIMTEIINSNKSETFDNYTQNNKEQSPKLILLYTKLFSQEIWPGLDTDEASKLLQRCEYKNCQITYNKTLLATASAVVFHGVDVLSEQVNSPEVLNNLGHIRPLWQRWVFFMQESPMYYQGFDAYNGLFNWTMTYRSDSDIFIPYSHYKPLDKWDVLPSYDKNYAQGKSLLAAWVVSNCGKFRDSYVKELQKYINITIYGKCAKDFTTSEEKCKINSEECRRKIKRHKFYFAFENCFCKDYITEKYWQTSIKLGLVPVVMGGNYDERVAIPGSYIEASKFPSVEHLANYLIYLDRNDTAYGEYFAWKRKYKSIGYDKICELCRRLHLDDQKTTVYNDLGSFWGKEGACKPYENVQMELQKQINKNNDQV